MRGISDVADQPGDTVGGLVDGEVVEKGSEKSSAGSASKHDLVGGRFEHGRIGWTWSDVGVGFAVLVVAAPFYRYLLGMHLLATGGSLLAIGIQHASWNAAGSLDGVHGDWQYISAAILLTGLIAVSQRSRRREQRPLAPASTTPSAMATRA